jgi:hypothetical protein
MATAAAKRMGYRIDLKPPHDNMIDWDKRDRPTRWLSMIFTTLVLVFAPALFLRIWGILINETMGTLGFWIGFAIGGVLVARFAPARMWVYNPEWTGYVTQNALSGKMVIYGPGLHPSHWWEVRNKEGNWSLQVITRSFETSIATKTSSVTVSGKYEYAMNLPQLDRAIGIDESTIDEGITAFIKSSLTEVCAEKNAEDVTGMIGELNQTLAEEFMKAEKDDVETPEDERLAERLGDKYGFVTVSIVIDNIKLPAAVQKTRDAKDEAAQLFEVVAKMYGYEDEDSKNQLRADVRSGKITKQQYNEMLNRALAASENATMNITVVEGNPENLLKGAAAQVMQGGSK